MRRPPAIILAFTAAVLAASQVQGQSLERCGSVWSFSGVRYMDLDRMAAVTDTGFWSAIQRGGAPALACGVDATTGSRVGHRHFRPFRGLTLRPTPAFTVSQLNTGYPRDFLDGLRWAGRGWSSAVNAGVVASWGPFTAALAPVISYQQNQSFPTIEVVLPGHSPWASYWHTTTIDWPQRFGASSFWWTSLGQSYAQASAYGVTAGVSTENLRWGPARRNPLLMSGTSAGFPHVFVGTAHATDVWIGRLQAEAIWGRLSESQYFDTNPDDNTRLFAGLVVALEPRLLDGLTIGLARSFLRYIPPGGLPLGQQIFGPYSHVQENPTTASGKADDQLLSVFSRWAFPRSAFEIYAEYAREDHWQDVRDLLMEPDHSRGYTIGFQKIYDGLLEPSSRLRITGEMTNLNRPPTWQSGRSLPSFYTHSQIRQGYTQEGQLLGAPIGPGSDTQYLGVDFIDRGRLLGIDFERIRWDDDTYYQQLAWRYTYRGHDLELTTTLHGAATVGPFQLVGAFGYSFRYNRGFVGMQKDYVLPHDVNLSFTLGASWLPGRRSGLAGGPGSRAMRPAHAGGGR